MRLSLSKEDYLSSLNRLKEKAIRSNFSLDMTNEMIALVSNCEERLRPQKCDKKDGAKVWATFFQPSSPNTERKKLHTKAMITYK